MTIRNVNDTADIQYHAKEAMKSLQNLAVGNMSAKQLRIIEGVTARLGHIADIAGEVNTRIGNDVSAKLDAMGKR